MPYRALFKHNDFFNRIVIVGLKNHPINNLFLFTYQTLSKQNIYFHFIIEKFKIQAIFFIEYGFFNLKLIEFVV